MDLFERDLALRDLGAALGDVSRGEGRVALVSGEAGIGKTALAERFSHTHGSSVRMLWGACDPLSTPRPLGPLHDMAAQADGDLPALLATTAERGAIFGATLAEF